eukprot:CAMPEP_0114234302 /NCGR_PEP_ID=MMETSP0058-20121206/5639_1 /TAXON_ID=36894 /ORGANISM="Pyramimonas parkeae, CCMP726" /LENGTH=524 /DNA_ID=CAMNT_0001345977 /DNA_START=65 /DNA_END=1639 /DNA_ORIENTATION=+
MTSSSKVREVIAAVDQGTQSTRAVLYDVATMKPFAHQQLPHRQIYPQPGWTEHDPREIYDNALQCLQAVHEKAVTACGDQELKVCALGITNQRETVIVWDKETGHPLHNAIVWLDTRTQDICDELVVEFGSTDHFRDLTGLPISTYFSAMKLRWLLKNVPEVKSAADAGRAMFGTVDSWLIYNLTGGVKGGVHVTDVTNASRTMLMDLSSTAWHAPTVKALGVPMAMLPKIVSNAEVYGTVAEGPMRGVPITGCLGDQHAAALGQRCRPGEAKNTYGTGCFLLLNTGPTLVPSTHGLLTTVAFKLGPDAPIHYALEGSVAVAGAAISWLKDNLGLIEKASDVEALARQVDDNGGMYFVPAFNGLFAPHWRSDARGCVVGLTQYCTKAHFARAALEAICFQSCEVLDAMRKDAGSALQIQALRVDGGAAANNLLLQLQADLLGVPVVRPEDIETTARGAALAAGMGAGLWDASHFLASDMTAIKQLENPMMFHPSIPDEVRHRSKARWTDAVQRSLGWERASNRA